MTTGAQLYRVALAEGPPDFLDEDQRAEWIKNTEQMARRYEHFDATHEPFDVHRNCPKCGGVGRAKHTSEGFWWKDISRIERRCERCDYVWNEVPLDRVAP